MRYLLIAMLGLVMFSGIVQADDPVEAPAVLNDPSSAWENFKEVVSTLEPSADVIADFNHKSEFKVGSSIRLYSFEKWENPVINKFDTRVGWLETHGAFGTLSLALDRVTGNDLLKNVHISGLVGGDFDRERDQLVLGGSVGAKVKF
jgi:hypothetical protein